jgi:hypothetical protein
MSFPNGHGADLAPESGPDDHHDVHEHEEQERGKCEEVDGACGLEAAEAVSAGDMARPVTTISGAATNTTIRYESFCSTPY